ncbi:Lipid storage droplets surface-binding protein 1 [Varanus komodoensis]|nr:Lipid storage droplets surface-binding protein 1 [Varanus komodoensis]
MRALGLHFPPFTCVSRILTGWLPANAEHEEVRFSGRGALPHILKRQQPSHPAHFPVIFVVNGNREATAYHYSPGVVSILVFSSASSSRKFQSLSSFVQPQRLIFPGCLCQLQAAPLAQSPSASPGCCDGLAGEDGWLEQFGNHPRIFVQKPPQPASIAGFRPRGSACLAKMLCQLMSSTPIFCVWLCGPSHYVPWLRKDSEDDPSSCMTNILHLEKLNCFGLIPPVNTKFWKCRTIHHELRTDNGFLMWKIASAKCYNT